MNNSTIADGLFGKTRQAVMAFLYGRDDTSFYTKEILDAVNSGSGTVQRELKNLTDSGIIVRETRGRQVYYRANDASPIFNELKSIVRKTFGIADVLRKCLADTPGIQAAFIFGSVARSADDRKSDIDVMIIGDVSFADAVSRLSPAESKLGREINAVVYPPAEFLKKIKEDHHFVTTVLKGEKIFIAGDDNELARLAQ